VGTNSLSSRGRLDDSGHTIRQGPDLVEPLFRHFLPEER
jgi:hypothetical protein